ncbi:MAG: hypothetical protein QME51_06815 [Planctomycetota bacterium]|nr:hypothetical protein [Planctomycetota bacterium]MDI6788064.1 hypothetical protein [Planctomycetota bacterium]
MAQDIFSFNTQNILNLIIGGFVGIYPFVSWKLAGRFLFARPRKPLIFGFIVLKLVVIGIIMYVFTNMAFFAGTPFIIGMILSPLIITMVILFKYRT